jgi:hypothetical protein
LNLLQQLWHLIQQALQGNRINAERKLFAHALYNTSEEKYNEKIGGTVHSRLVDIHLSELHISQIPSFESDFVIRITGQHSLLLQ